MAQVTRCDACGTIIEDADASKLYIDNDVDKNICQDCKRKIVAVFEEEN